MEENKILSRLADVEIELNELVESIDSLCIKIEKLSGSDIGERLIACWNTLTQTEDRLTRALCEFDEKIEGNQKMFLNMINEYKGIVALERASFTKRKNAFLKILDSLDI